MKVGTKGGLVSFVEFYFIMDEVLIPDRGGLGDYLQSFPVADWRHPTGRGAILCYTLLENSPRG